MIEISKKYSREELEEMYVKATHDVTVHITQEASEKDETGNTSTLMMLTYMMAFAELHSILFSKEEDNNDK